MFIFVLIGSSFVLVGVLCVLTWFSLSLVVCVLHLTFLLLILCLDNSASVRFDKTLKWPQKVDDSCSNCGCFYVEVAF